MEIDHLRISRGEFIRLGLAALGWVALSPTLSLVATAPAESAQDFVPTVDFTEQTKPPQKTLFSIFGLHAVPDHGGGLYPDLALSDAIRLRGHGVTVINPGLPFLELFSKHPLVVRIYHPQNHYDAKLVEEEGERIFKQGIDAIFQTNNEVNLLRETGGVFISPKEHLERQFLPAANMIIEVARRYKRRAQILITPFAQNAPAINGIDEKSYSEEFYDRLAPYMEKLACDLYLGLHAYIFQPDEDPLRYVEDRYALFRQRTGMKLPIKVTEGGLHHNEYSNFSPAVIAKATIKLLETVIPSALPLETFNLWVAANYAQRPLRHRQLGNPDLDVFEKAALRGISGVTETFLAIESEVAKQASIQRIHVDSG